MDKTALYSKINLLEVFPDGTLWGTAGEVGRMLKLNPTQDMRMCLSAHQPGFVAGFSRMLTCLPVNFGLTFSCEVATYPMSSPPAGTASLKKETNGGKADTQRFHPLLAEIAKRKGNGSAHPSRQSDYYAFLWSGGLNPLKLKLLPLEMPKVMSQKSAALFLEENESTVKEVTQTLSGSLASMGVKSAVLNQEEVIERYWRWLNPGKSAPSTMNFNGGAVPSIDSLRKGTETIGPPKLLHQFSLRSQLACANSDESQQYFYLDGMYHAAVSFYTEPEELFLGSLDNLLDILPEGSRYLLSILVPDQEEFLDTLKLQRRRTIAIAQESKSKDYESQAKESDLDAIITRCRNEGERIYVVWSAVILRSKDLATLVEWQKELIFAMREIFAGAQGLTEDLLHRRMFIASLPFGGHLSPRRKLMLGSSISALAPLSRSWMGTRGRGMTVYSRSREPINLDIFDEGTPRHGVVIGTTGSGKSFSANMLLLSLLIDPNIRALVIDIGGSFKRLTEVLGGAYFDIRLDENYAINPLLSRNSLLRDDGSLDPELLGAQTSLVLKIAGTGSGPARHVLEKAIERAFRAKEEPLLSDILSELKNGSWEDSMKPQALSIANEFLPYCEGVYSLLLSRPSRIRPFDSQITAFDLAGLKEHKILQSILVNVIAFSINRQLSDKAVKKVVIIDEAWEFFNDKESAELIARLYRQARKQNASIITLSQSPVEFLNSAASSAILANKHWTMALKMKADHELLDKFGFSDQAIERSKAMQMSPKAYSEVMIGFGDNPARIARISPTSLEYWTATTNAEEFAREEKLMKENNWTALESIREMAKREPVVEW